MTGHDHKVIFLDLRFILDPGIERSPVIIRARAATLGIGIYKCAEGIRRIEGIIVVKTVVAVRFGMP